MNNNRTDCSIYREKFGISPEILRLAERAEAAIKNKISQIEAVREFNQIKVLYSMHKNKVSETHFAGTTGYGYDDRGREVLDRVYADVFGSEDALVRQNIVAGTHALAIALFGNLHAGEHLLSVTGSPYDTLEEMIGIRGDAGNSLKSLGVRYSQVELLNGFTVDYGSIEESIRPNTKIIFIQRSPGYSWRPSISTGEISKIVSFVKELKKDLIVMVDNCYGEFVEKTEPTETGADLVAGSLIKNPGGGLALTGGYVAGKHELVENAADKLTAPGLGRNLGATLGQNRNMFQGLFMAPHTVTESLKGAILCAYIMEALGFETSPRWDADRTDIIQAVKFNDPDLMVAFCQGIQSGSPVDAFVTPQPWEMPGYDCPVIMAAGGFVQGSSIELSADGPYKPPYTAYLQGGLVYESVKLGLLTAVQKMKQLGRITI
ncbi:MAG: methionine gamma-lyase family protein [Eubacteriales bacterium]|nr:methionine gamma-lyase family protein [Eubacteriales bacterium]